jgi:hypothetical protein
LQQIFKTFKDANVLFQAGLLLGIAKAQEEMKVGPRAPIPQKKLSRKVLRFC